MLDAIKTLLDSDLVNESTRTEIQEAWDSKLNEVREEVRAEIREEFAGRYDHDKQVMVKALDTMVTESLESEISEIVSEKKSMATDRVNFNQKMKKISNTFETFLTTVLTKELKELKKDRTTQQESIKKLEKFVVKSLSEELGEFAADKQAVVEQKVKLVSEAKSRLAKLERGFIKKSSKLVSEAVAKNLEKEIGQLKEDIKVARENMFARKIFEAFATEFAATHLNENTEIQKLRQGIITRDEKLSEATKVLERKQALIENTERKVRIVNDRVKREKLLTSLLKPLGNEKASVMNGLLEGVQTDKLKSAFNKYLPAVQETGNKKSKKVLAESHKEVTGNKQNTGKQRIDANVVDLADIQRLAGVRK